MEAEMERILGLVPDEPAFNKALRKLLEEKEEMRNRILELEAKVAQLESVQGNDLFEISTDPMEIEDVGHGTDVHMYRVLQDNTLKSLEESDEPKEERLGPRHTCFNCGGDHMIANCPEPKNPIRIAQNRRNFARQNSTLANVRYHVDGPQRFSHIRPGILSKKLRDALGIKPNQLPPHIYHMRRLGYPPGWLREAEIHHSGMALYLNKDKKVANLGEEDGEIKEDSDRMSYDISKIIEWPGFNVIPPLDTLDEYYNYHCPPMSGSQMKSQMVNDMTPKSQKGYVRGEMQDTSTKKLDEEEEGGNSPQNDDKSSQNEDKISPNDDKSSQNDDKSSQNVANSFQNDEIRFSQTESAVTTPSATFESGISAPLINPSTSTLKVRSVKEGTPIVSTHSPFDSLPDQKKWAKDTTDHILYENLPDATDNWKNLIKVIKRGRNLIQDNQPPSQEEDSS